MVVSSARPYFCPYPGYFATALASDVFVILDTVQFPRGSTWITRNRFKNDQGALWLSIPVWKKGLGLQKIADVRICPEGRWQRKHLDGIRQAYRHAPYLDEHLGFLEDLLSSGQETILEMNLKAITYVMDFLRAHARVTLLSDLGTDEQGSALLVDICLRLSADRYLAPAPARSYLEEDLFRGAGIELTYLRPMTPVYPQLWGEFMPNLSIFDLLLNCGPKAREMVGTVGR